VLVQCSAHGVTRSASVTPHERGGGLVEVRWHEPQRRVAPGQSVVFYDLSDERVLGGGIAG
jgi:tRNA-specific 2-thiouridylase